MRATTDAPKPKKKSDRVLFRELREQLHYWQMMARMEARGLRATREKCKTIAEKMRELQKKK